MHDEGMLRAQLMCARHHCTCLAGLCRAPLHMRTQDSTTLHVVRRECHVSGHVVHGARWQPAPALRMPSHVDVFSAHLQSCVPRPVPGTCVGGLVEEDISHSTHTPLPSSSVFSSSSFTWPCRGVVLLPHVTMLKYHVHHTLAVGCTAHSRPGDCARAMHVRILLPPLRMHGRAHAHARAQHSQN